MATQPQDDDQNKFFSVAYALAHGGTATPEDIKFFLKYQGSFDKAAYDKASDNFDKATAAGKLPGATDMDALLDGAKQRLASDPTYKQQMFGLAKQAAAGKLSDQIKTGLNIALAGTDIGVGLNQQAKGQSLLNQARQPSRPAVLQHDAALSSALNDAQRGTYDEPTAIQANRQQNLNNYLSEKQAAIESSGGQAGAVNANLQNAYSRRAAADLASVPAENQIHAQEKGRYGQLLGMKLGENQAIQQSQAQNYPYELQQYNNNRNLGYNLQAAGLYNTRQGLGNFAAAVPSVARQVSNRNYDDLYNQFSMYGHDHAMTAVNAAQGLDTIYGTPPSSPYTPNPDDYNDAYAYQKSDY